MDGDQDAWDEAGQTDLAEDETTISAVTEEMLADIRTRFVRDRLRETPFARARFIAELAHWEQSEVYHQAKQRLGWAGNMFYVQFRDAHPVLCACIRRELADGTYTPPDEYHRLLAARDAEVERTRAEERRVRAARLQTTGELWLRAGGRP